MGRKQGENLGEFDAIRDVTALDAVLAESPSKVTESRRRGPFRRPSLPRRRSRTCGASSFMLPENETRREAEKRGVPESVPKDPVGVSLLHRTTASQLRRRAGRGFRSCPTGARRESVRWGRPNRGAEKRARRPDARSIEKRRAPPHGRLPCRRGSDPPARSSRWILKIKVGQVRLVVAKARPGASLGVKESPPRVICKSPASASRRYSGPEAARRIPLRGPIEVGGARSGAPRSYEVSPSHSSSIGNGRPSI